MNEYAIMYDPTATYSGFGVIRKNEFGTDVVAVGFDRLRTALLKYRGRLVRKSCCRW